MYEYPSYDYRGKFNVYVDLDQNKSVSKDDKAVLDANVKQKVDQYLHNQKVNLNTAQKQALYETLAQQPNQFGGSKADKFTRVRPIFWDRFMWMHAKTSCLRSQSRT